MKFYIISFFLVFIFAGCALAQNDYKVAHWNVDENKELNDLGVFIVNLENTKDSSVTSVSETNGKLSAISVFTKQGESAGIQFKKNSNIIDYIRFSPWFSSGSYERSYLKLYRDSEGNWILTEYADASEKKVLRSVELK